MDYYSKRPALGSIQGARGWKHWAGAGGRGEQGRRVKCVPEHLKVQGHRALSPHSPSTLQRDRKKPEPGWRGVERFENLRASWSPQASARGRTVLVPVGRRVLTGIRDRIPAPAHGSAWTPGTCPAWVMLGQQISRASLLVSMGQTRIQGRTYSLVTQPESFNLKMMFNLCGVTFFLSNLLASQFNIII